MTYPVVVDAAGAVTGGAARFKVELDRYLARTGRTDVRVLGTGRRFTPAWLVRRELAGRARGRHVALNNVGFVTAGDDRWTLLGNALNFLTDREEASLEPSLRAYLRQRTPLVRLACHRSHVLVAPSTAMAERIVRVMPSLRARVAVRPHPVSPDSIPGLPREPNILCPVVFASYKQMDRHLIELLNALDESGDPETRLRVTANRSEVPTHVADHPRVDLVGRLDHHELRQLWGRNRVIYFPPGLESFGYPLAEARASGHPVIARDTAQNREIAGPALCGYAVGDAASLGQAAKLALTTDMTPDPGPFDPVAYFDWLLGSPS